MSKSNITNNKYFLPVLIAAISIILVAAIILAVVLINAGDDLNVDTNNDGKPDINIDTDDDGKADVNVDTDGDNVPDKNVDTDGDNVPDQNVDPTPGWNSGDGIELPVIPLD